MSWSLCGANLLKHIDIGKSGREQFLLPALSGFEEDVVETGVVV